MTMKKLSATLIKIFISVALLAILFWELNWQAVAEEFKNLNPYYLLLFLFFQIIAMLISSKKWQAIVAFQGGTLSLWDGFKAYLTGTFVNNFLPSTIGGDIYRSLWLIKRGTEKSKAFSSVIFDRVNGLCITLVLAFVMGIFVWQKVAPFPQFLTLSYAVVLGIIVVFLASILFMPQQSISRIPWKKLRAFLEETNQYRAFPVWLIASFWSSLFIFFGLGVSNYLLFSALGYTIPFLPFFGLVLLMALYVSLPLSINNIGIKEWSYGVLFVFLGVSFEAAVTVALISRVLQTGLSLLALPVYLLEKKKVTLPLPSAPDSETL